MLSRFKRQRRPGKLQNQLKRLLWTRSQWALRGRRRPETGPRANSCGPPRPRSGTTTGLVAVWAVFSLFLFLPLLTPTRAQGQPEAGQRRLAGESVARVVLPTRPARTGIALQAVTTATAVLEEGGTKAPTTYTAGVVAPSGSLLDRLTYNKPGIWGNKGFYVGLAVVYVVLLVLFFRLLFQLARQLD